MGDLFLRLKENKLFKQNFCCFQLLKRLFQKSLTRINHIVDLLCFSLFSATVTMVDAHIKDIKKNFQVMRSSYVQVIPFELKAQALDLCSGTHLKMFDFVEWVKIGILSLKE